MGLDGFYRLCRVQKKRSIGEDISRKKNKWRLKVKVKLLSRVWLFATPWTVAHQLPPSMGFSRQEYWSGLPFPSPGDLPNPGIEPRSDEKKCKAYWGLHAIGLSWLEWGEQEGKCGMVHWESSWLVDNWHWDQASWHSWMQPGPYIPGEPPKVILR